MADQIKYVSLERLGQYDGLIKNYINTADSAVDAKSLKCLAVVGDKIYFFKTDSVPMVEGQIDTSKAAADVTIASSDITALKTLVGDTTMTTEATTITAAINEIDAHADSANTAIGTIGDLATTATTLVGAVNEVKTTADAADTLSKTNATAIGDSTKGLTKQVADLETLVGTTAVATQITNAVEALDKADTAVDHQFVTAVSEEDGVITVSRAALVAADIPSLTLEKITDAGTAAATAVATVAIGTEGEAKKSLPTVEQVETYVASEIAGLEGAMHFRAVVTRNEGETDAQAIARVVTTPKAGDVVVMSDNAKEYIYTGTAWREVGDEGLYVQKSQTIAGIDQEDAITADELKTALDIDDLESDVDDLQTAVGTATEGETLGTGLTKRVEDVEAKVGSTSVATQITTAIEALDYTTAPTTGEDYVKSITEADGVIAPVYGSFNFDEKGAASAVQGSTTSTVKDVEDKVDAIGSVSEDDIAALFTTE